MPCTLQQPKQSVPPPAPSQPPCVILPSPNSQNTVQPSEPTRPTPIKKKPYNIDYIVNDQTKVQELVPVSNSQSKDVQNQNFPIQEHKNLQPLCEPQHNLNSTVLNGNKDRCLGNVGRYPDVTSEVKHARTPLNTIIQQTHSPQLPVPSPNYPIPTDGFSKVDTIVPTVNNNYIMMPPTTSQCESKENVTDSHSPHSNRLNGVNDSRQIENLDCNECETNTQCDNQKSAEGESSSFTVLNIPNLNFHTPPTKRQKLSKIDLATMRRKMRRQKMRKCDNEQLKNGAECNMGSSNSSICSSSDSESDGSEIDLWIRSGPPCKLDSSPNKLSFLKMFGLTTHNEKNCK